jgi:very-short-patch-repair endonuclease
MKLTGPPSTIRRAKKSRREMSLPEVLLWQQLCRRPAGLKWRHQHPAGPYELDFSCDAVRLAVEVDGEAHKRGDRPARDARRDTWLAGRGVRTLRMPASAVLRDMESVLRHIVDCALARSREAKSSPAGGGEPPKAVKGADAPASVLPPAPSTTPFGRGPPPPAGEDW